MNWSQKLSKDGINGIVLTVIKDMKTEIKTTTTGGYHGGYYPHFGGYYGAYYSPYGYGGGVYIRFVQDL